MANIFIKFNSLTNGIGQELLLQKWDDEYAVHIKRNHLLVLLNVRVSITFY